MPFHVIRNDITKVAAEVIRKAYELFQWNLSVVHATEENL